MTDNDCAIRCDPKDGPMFDPLDIYIPDHCNEKDSCFINNDVWTGYECHPKYKSSLFVNTAGPDNTNRFSVLDYEIYTYN